MPTDQPEFNPAEPAETPASRVPTYSYVALAAVVALLALSFEALALLSAGGRTDWPDAAPLAWVVTHRDAYPGVTRFFAAVTTFGNPWGGTVAVLAVTLGLVALVVLRVGEVRWSEVAIWLGSLFGGRCLSVGLKVLYQRPRPPELMRMVVETSYSFPSGHSVFASVYFATLAILIVRHIRAWHPGLRVLVIVLCALAAVTVAASRVWLAAHYVTDVTGGLLLGLAWVIVVAIARRAWFDYRHKQDRGALGR